MALATNALPVSGVVQADTRSLCVDLDGTLILSDLLYESILVLIRRKPLCILSIIFWLLKGRSVLKAEVASRICLKVETLPYNVEFVRWLESERACGRRLWLCTGANEMLATAVARHLNIFEGVLASSYEMNLVAKRKAGRLVEHFGARGFDYCGNDWRDIEVWKVARGAIVVRGAERLTKEVAKNSEVIRVFPRGRWRWRGIVRELRIYQWAKNALVFVPLLAAHRGADIDNDISAILAAIAFCLCASSVYVINDMLDLEADRVHPRKAKRPMAAGEISISTGALVATMLLCLAVGMTILLPAAFRTVLLTYFSLTLAYSFALKGLLLVDVMTLAVLYTLRIVAGSVAIGAPLSFWLLWFSMFLFLSLAFVKRFAELDALHRSQRVQAAGRDYSVDDLPVLQSLGSAAGYVSAVVLALYVNSPEVETLYRRPGFIWFLCVLLLYWISRVWVKTQRGEMHDDPVVFALKDRMSRAIGLIAAVTVSLAV